MWRTASALRVAAGTGAGVATLVSEAEEVVPRSFGQGKVLMLTTDQSWRLRHRVGDTRHHRFWGQVLRWGSGEKLRAGNTFVRLGTDKLRYLHAPAHEYTATVEQLCALPAFDWTLIVEAGDGRAAQARTPADAAIA